MQYKAGIAVVIVFAMLIAGLSIIKTNGEEQSEKVFFMWDESGHTINFTALCNGNNYTWYFGNGSIAYGKYVTYTYSSQGKYNVTLYVDGKKVDEREISTSDDPPHADFFWVPTTPLTYQQVTFFDNSTDNDGYIINWSWDIGNDGTIDGYGKYMEYTFTTPGSHDVTLRVIDNEGRMDAVTYQIFVKNRLPVPKFYWTKLNGSIIFNASWSYDEDGYIVNYTWNFGDGSIGYGKVVSHDYVANKVYNVTLTVRDDYGERNSTSMNVNVLNNPPVANFYWEPSSPTDLDFIYFYSTSNDSDGYIVNYTWQFGDGSIAYGRNVSHKYADNGIYNVTLFVLDNEGAYSTMEKEIVVRNVPPVANFTYSPLFPLPNKTIVFTSTSYDKDGYIASLIWNFGDGNSSSGKIVNHTYSNHGIYNVTLVAVDNDGAESIKEIYLVVADYYVNKSVYDPVNHTWDRIQDAVDNATNNSFIYVMKGWYNEIVKVNKSVYILGKNASVNSFILYDNVSIENFEIKKARNGVVLEGNYSIINGCKFEDNNVSINISGSHNTIIGNEINGSGIFVTGENNLIESNSIYRGEYGIRLKGEGNEILLNNISSTCGICINYGNNFVISNTIHKCNYGIMALNSSMIENNSIYNNSYAIYGNNFSIQDCNIWNNSYGIKGWNIAIYTSNLRQNKVGIEANESTIYGSSVDGYINTTQLYSWNSKYTRANINSSVSSLNDTITRSYIRGNLTATNTTIKGSKIEAGGGALFHCVFDGNDDLVFSSAIIENCSFARNNALTLQDRNVVRNCSFAENEYGLRVHGNGNEISYNQILKNEYGIEMDGNGNELYNNTIDGNVYGLSLSYSSYGKIFNNTISNNTYNIDITGEEINQFYHEFYGNKINGLPLFYSINGSNISISQKYGFIGIISCKNVTIENQSLSHNGKSIVIFNSEDVNIENSSIFNNLKGIYIKRSKETSLNNLNIYNNSYGISFISSYYNSIKECKIFRNDVGANVFDIEKSDGENVFKSEFYDNKIGILLQNQGGNEIYGNVDLIKIDHSSNNIFEGNATEIISNNGEMNILNSDVKNIQASSSNIEIDDGAIHFIEMNSGNIKIYYSNLSGKMNVNNGEVNIKYSNIRESNIKINSLASVYIYNCNFSKSYVNINGSGNISNSHFFENEIAIKIDGNATIYNSTFYGNEIGVYLIKGKINKGEIYNNTYGCIVNGSSEIKGVLFHDNKIALQLNYSSIVYQNSFWKNLYGIIANGNGSRIYCNNFVYNNKNAVDNGNNTWNSSIGNYWDDYAGVDENGDGIGDIPYPISNSYDMRPLMTACLNASPVPNEPPVANFTYYPSSPHSFDEITFVDESTDPNGKEDITQWLWKFGDGITSNQQNPRHRYEKPGSYNVTLVVEDRAGATSQYNLTVNVSNLPPIANFTYSPQNATSYTLVSFEALASDSDGYIVNYTWQFGDGSIAYGRNVSHTYSKYGLYNVNLTVKDNLNATASYVKTIKIANRPPSADFEFYPASPTTGEEITFTDLSSDTDGKIVEWHWEFGDGTASIEKNATHAYAKPGTYTVKLTVKDDGGATATYEKVIEIKAKETPGMEFIALLIALGVVLIMRKFK